MLYSDIGNDIRLVRRCNQIYEAMCTSQSSIINQFCKSHTSSTGARRFLNNENVTIEQLSESSYSRCSRNITGKHVLAIQDTTELNYSSHSGRLQVSDTELGPVGNNKDIGFFLHPTLAIDAQQKFPLGFSSIIEWNRKWEKQNKHERLYKELPIENKESYRWLKSAFTSKETLSDAEMVTVIGDRESDIYEEFALVPDECTHLLIRSSWNRRLASGKEQLFEFLSNLITSGTYTCQIVGNRKRVSRQALMEVKFAEVEIACPQRRVRPGLPEKVALYAIEAKENTSTIPENEEPVHWRLLTTHPVESVEMAQQCLEWYALRWHIEELFRILKKQGLNIEASQLERGSSLKKLALLSIETALKIMQLTLAREGNVDISPEQVFTKEETHFQELLLKQTEGKTAKQKNPHPRDNLAWSTWIIARLGGWKGYSSSSTPGNITIKRGLDAFYQQYEGWKLALQSFGRDVYAE